MTINICIFGKLILRQAFQILSECLVPYNTQGMAFFLKMESRDLNRKTRPILQTINIYCLIIISGKENFPFNLPQRFIGSVLPYCDVLWKRFIWTGSIPVKFKSREKSGAWMKRILTLQHPPPAPSRDTLLDIEGRNPVASNQNKDAMLNPLYIWNMSISALI